MAYIVMTPCRNRSQPVSSGTMACLKARLSGKECSRASGTGRDSETQASLCRSGIMDDCRLS